MLLFMCMLHATSLSKSQAIDGFVEARAPLQQPQHWSLEAQVSFQRRRAVSRLVSIRGPFICPPLRDVRQPVYGRQQLILGRRRKEMKLKNTFSAEYETGRNNRKSSFSAPKTKTKQKFGRALLKVVLELKSGGYKETRNVWQSLAYSPLGAAVSPPSKQAQQQTKTELPSGKRAKNARSISLPSLWQHYLVAMVTSFDKLEIKVHIHHLHVKRFHMVKILRKFVQYVRRYSTKYACFLAVSYLTFSNELHYRWSYLAEVHQIFTRYSHINSHIISAVKARIQTVTVQLIFERQCKECKWYQSAFMAFSQNQLIAMATSLDKSENMVQVYRLHSKRFHMVKRL